MTADAKLPESTGGAASWRLVFIMLASFAGLCAATLLLPHDPYIRYQQLLPTIQFRAVWGYERTMLDPTPIDVAVIGNSRLQAAVSGPELERELSRRLGRPVRVANLSMPQEGRNAHYVIARRLLEHHPEVRLIILSAIEQMPREGHPAFRNMADARDIVTAPVLISRDYFPDLAYLPFRQMSLFIQTRFPDAFGVRKTLDRAQYDGPQYDSTYSFDTPTGNHVDRDTIHTAAELLPDATARAQSITPPVLPKGAADFEFPVERHYTRKIADLARAHGTGIAFLYVPIFHYPLPLGEAAFYQPLGPVMTASFVSPDPSLYSDYGHLNRRGATRLSAWLAAQLADRKLVGVEKDKAGAPLPDGGM